MGIRLRLLTKCGVQGDHPPAGVWGRAPKPYAAAFFASVASVRRTQETRLFPKPRVFQRSEPGAMGIRLSACPKKSDSPSFPAFWKAQMMETPAQRTLSAVPVSSHTPSGTDGASCPEFPSHEALAPFASVPQRNDASGFLRFPLFFVALQSASQFHKHFPNQNAFSQSKCKKL